MKQNLSLTMPIFPAEGVGDFVLGMSARDLLPVIMEAEYHDIKVSAHYPRLFEYVYKDSLSLYIDIVQGVLVRIDLCNNFQGLYEECIGIGSTVGELRQIRKDISFDEAYLLVGQNAELILRLNVESDIDNLDDVIDNKIELITLEIPDWMIL